MSADSLDDDAVINDAVWQYIATHYDELYRMCLKAARGDALVAEELMSDEVYRQMTGLLERWDRKRSFSTYCNAYFYRHLQKSAAKRFNAKAALLSIDYDNGFKHNTAYHPVQSNEQEAKLMVSDLLEVLTPLERTIIVLTKMYSFTYREVANKLGIGLGTVNKHVVTAIDKMREAGN